MLNSQMMFVQMMLMFVKTNHAIWPNELVWLPLLRSHVLFPLFISHTITSHTAFTGFFLVFGGGVHIQFILYYLIRGSTNYSNKRK